MDKVIIYTDGGCSNNQERCNFGGWGAILSFNGKVKEIYGGEANTTNNKMELLACIKALETLKSDKYPVEIYSDSAYIVNCIQQKWYEKWQRNNWKTAKKEPVLNKDLWERLLELTATYNVKFIKVKGHAGIELNERADQLAQEGIKSVANN